MPNYRLDANQYADNQQAMAQRRMHHSVADQAPFTHEKHSIRRQWQPDERKANNAYYSQPPRDFSKKQANFYEKLEKQPKMSHDNGLLKGLPAGRGKLFGVTLFILVTLWVTAYQLMPFHYVNQIRVSGNRYTSSQAIIEAAAINKFTPIKEVYRQKQVIEEVILNQNPTISQINFRRRNWAYLDLEVIEHQVVALQDTRQGLTAVLDNGEIASLDQLHEAGLQIDVQAYPLLQHFDNQSGKMAQVAQALIQLDTTILSQISSIEPNAESQKQHAIIVKMKDGNSVKAVLSSFSKKISYYNQIVQQLEGKTGEINFEVGAYFTPANGETNLLKVGNN